MVHRVEHFQFLHRNATGSAIFDFLRWIAAAYVVVFHLRPVLFAGASSLTHTELVVKLLYAGTSLGYQFVMLFFVMSGYLIASNVVRSMMEGTWSWKSYLIGRLTRLWIVLIPALVLSVILANVEMVWFPKTNLYFTESIHGSVFLGNVFFLQGILVPNFAQNLPLWSLSYEFWYYILFPCLVLMVVSKRWITRIAYGGVVLGLGIFVGKDIMLYFLIWLLGAALIFIPRFRLVERMKASMTVPVTSVILVGVLFWGKMYVTNHHLPTFDMMGGFPPDAVVSLVFAALLYQVIHKFNHPADSIGSWLVKVGPRFASFSYTLYLTHYPIVNLLRVWLGNGQWGVWAPTLRHFAYGLCILLFIVCYSYGISCVTEARTSTVRRWIMRRLNPRGATSSAPMAT